MSDLKVGDLVRCVDSSLCNKRSPLVKGKTYLITEIKCNVLHFLDNNDTWGYYGNRFQKIGKQPFNKQDWL